MAEKNRPENDAEPSFAPTQTTPKKKEQRYVTVRGIKHAVVKSQFDVKANCVIDTVEVKKIVKNRKGDDVEVTLYKKGRCMDPAIQAKYAVSGSNLINVEE